MKKIFKNKKLKILALSTLSFGLLIPIIATTAVACANTKLKEEHVSPGNGEKQTLSAVQSVSANDLGLTGTAYANLDAIINNSGNFVFNNLKKFLTGDTSLITANDVGVKSAEINPNKTSISFNLVVAAQKFYVNNKLSQKEFSQATTINGFQPLEEPKDDPVNVTSISQTNIKQLLNVYQGSIFNSGILNLNYFPNLVTIADNTFANSATNIFKEPLTQVIFNPNIISIGANAFSNNSIIKITIDKSSKLTSIGKDAFSNNQLTSITVANEKIKTLFSAANFSGTINVLNSDSTNPPPIKPEPPAPPPVQPPPVVTDEEFAWGGQITNTKLITSSYNLVANALGLVPQDVLSRLDMKALNANLHKTYPNLNVSLANGSNETTGVLNLTLNGSYSNNSGNVSLINNKPMLISGFYTFKSNYVLSINSASINLNKYFGNLQTKNSMLNWTTNDWMNQYLETLNASFPFDGEGVSVLELYKNQFLKNFSFNFSLDNKNKPSLTIKAIWEPKQYQNGTWDSIINSLNNSGEYPIRFNNTSLIQIPNLVQAKQYFVNQTIVDNTNAANYYASYVRNSLIKNLANNFTDFFNLIKYKDGFNISLFEATYFPKGKLYYKIDVTNTAIDANDVNGTLDFYASLVGSLHEEEQSVLKRFVIDGFKTLSNLNEVSEINQKPALQISHSSAFYNRLLRALKNEYPNKASLDKLVVNESVKISKTKIKPLFMNGSENLNLFISDNNMESNEAKINQYFKADNKTFTSLRIFGGSFTNIFKVSLGIFEFSLNKNLQQFGVKGIDIKIPDGSLWTFIKNHAQSFSLQIPIQLELSLYGATKNYTGLMFTSILLSDFGYNTEATF